MTTPTRVTRVPAAATGPREGFVGREAELGWLEAALDAARAGHPRLVLVEGEAGIGKTALVEQFLQAAADARVLRGSGAEQETTLAFGVVEQLLTDVDLALPEHVSTLPVRGGRQADPLAVGAGLVELFGALQQDGPVVLVLDDAQWADTPSLHALTFALRRLRVDRVLAMVCVRDAADPHLPEGVRRTLLSPPGVRLRLEGLDQASLRELAVWLGVRVLPPRALRRLHAYTQGNPLHARALLQEVPPAVLRETARPLPAPRSFALLVVGRLAGCPAEAADLVAAVAVLGMTAPLELAARLAAVGDPLAALEQAIDARLLQERPGGPGVTVAFTHPLVRAAVYQALGPARRSALHTRAARLVTDPVAGLQHRILAATGTDPQLAVEVAEFARGQGAIGRWASAAEGLTAAARLTVAGPEHDLLLLQAVECLLLAGDVAEAAVLAGQVGTDATAGWREYIFGRLAAVAGRLPEAEARLTAAWRASDAAADPALGARVAGVLAYLCLYGARGLEAAGWVRRALELDPTGAGTDFLRFLELAGLAIAGRPEEALAQAAGLPDPTRASPAELDLLLGRGIVRMWIDDLAGAQQDLAGLVSAARDRSAAFRVMALAALCQVEFRRGRWDDALVHAELSASLATDTDQPWVAPYGHTVAAMVLAARGTWAAAEEHVAVAWAVSNGPDYPAGYTVTCMGEAHLRAAQADAAAVVAALGPLLALHDCDGVNEPGVVPWQDLLVDALVAVGDCEQAATVLSRYEELAAARGRRSAQLAAARARGTLETVRGNPQAAEEAFQAGLALADRVDEPFSRAQLHAAYGAFLRRGGQRSQAAAHLRAAQEGFAQLDARPYLASAFRAPSQLEVMPAGSNDKLVVACRCESGPGSCQEAR